MLIRQALLSIETLLQLLSSPLVMEHGIQNLKNAMSSFRAIPGFSVGRGVYGVGSTKQWWAVTLHSMPQHLRQHKYESCNCF